MIVIAQILVLLFQLTLVFLLVCLLYVLIRGFLGVPYVRSKRKFSKAMLDLARIKQGETIVDFGSGDGSILIHAAKEYGASGIGYEHLSILSNWAKIRARFSDTRKAIDFRTENFLKSEKLPNADVISIYLFPEMNVKLEPLLIRDYPKGTRLVSRTFTFPNLTLLETKKVATETIYLYEI